MSNTAALKRRIAALEALRAPPAWESRLTDEQREWLRQWRREIAEYRRQNGDEAAYWAFVAGDELPLRADILESTLPARCLPQPGDSAETLFGKCMDLLQLG